MTKNSLRPSFRLVLTQSLKAIIRRPGRALATATGVALGVAVLIASIGFASTTNAEVNAVFDATSATQIRIQDVATVSDTGLFDSFLNGQTFDERIQELDGVISGGLIWTGRGEVAVKLNTISSPTTLPLLVVSNGILQATGATIGSGRFYNEHGFDPSVPQVVLGPRAAQDLGIEKVSPGLSVLVDDRPMVVSGILESAGSAPELGRAIMLSASSLYELDPEQWETFGQSAIVRTELGAVKAVSKVLPYAVSPQDPQRVGLLIPPSVTELRDNVQSSLNGLAIGVAGFSVIVGGLGIMNSMLISVTQRSSEIGLRRALGASKRWILVQFLSEGLFLGSIGAFLGNSLAVLAIFGVCAVNGWEPVLSSKLLIMAPILGGIIGLLAAVYPASRAASLHPAMTLKQ